MWKIEMITSQVHAQRRSTNTPRTYVPVIELQVIKNVILDIAFAIIDDSEGRPCREIFRVIVSEGLTEPSSQGIKLLAPPAAFSIEE